MASTKKDPQNKDVKEGGQTDNATPASETGGGDVQLSPTSPSLFDKSDSSNEPDHQKPEPKDDSTSKAVAESKDSSKLKSQPKDKKKPSAKSRKDRKKEKGELLKKTKTTLEVVKKRGRGRPKKQVADESIIKESEVAVEMLKKKSLGINFSRLKQDKVAFEAPSTGTKSSFTIFSSLRHAVIDKAGSIEAGDAILRHFAELADKKHPGEGLISAIVREAALLFVLDEELAEKYRSDTPRGIHNTPPS